MTIVVYIAPNAEPVSISEAKTYCRIDSGSEDDPLVLSFITAARQAAEQELHRYLITQTLDAYFDAFPDYDDDYQILLPPLQSVTSITYVDTNGATQTLATNQYSVDSKSQPARITPAYGVSWPSTRNQNNAVIVRFVAGYGVASAVPQCVKNWMLMRIHTLWDNRAHIVVGANISDLPTAYIDGILDPERVTYRT